jgi:predicted Fe-Mo cluster-binding NifX family protein
LKIAVVSDNGENISKHYGMAQKYIVYSVEDGKVTGRQVLDKAAHGHGAGQHPEHGHGEHNCGGHESHDHDSMVANITDCDVVIGGGMGWGAFNSLKSYNLDVIVTDIESPEEAVQAYLAGSIRNLAMERLH